MKGQIRFINARKGFFGVCIEEGDYSVIELVDTCMIENGDIVSGNLHSLGSETLINITQNHSMSVFIQDIYSSERNAQAMVYR